MAETDRVSALLRAETDEPVGFTLRLKVSIEEELEEELHDELGRLAGKYGLDEGWDE